MHLEASDLVGSFGPFFLVDQVSLDLLPPAVVGRSLQMKSSTLAINQPTEHTYLADAAGMQTPG